MAYNEAHAVLYAAVTRDHASPRNLSNGSGNGSGVFLRRHGIDGIRAPLRPAGYTRGLAP
jgi:hypothetical protein